MRQFLWNYPYIRIDIFVENINMYQYWKFFNIDTTIPESMLTYSHGEWLCAWREGKMIFLADKTDENIGADACSSEREERKKANVRRRSLMYCHTVCRLILRKNGCFCRTTLPDQILCALKENAQWKNKPVI